MENSLFTFFSKLFLLSLICILYRSTVELPYTYIVYIIYYNIYQPIPISFQQPGTKNINTNILPHFSSRRLGALDIKRTSINVYGRGMVEIFPIPIVKISS